MDERRIDSRIPIAVYVAQHVEDDTHRCFVTNISTSGLYMEKPIGSFLRQSALVQLEIPLPDESEPIWASAEVVYDCFDPLFHGTAVRFTAMSRMDRERLSQFIADTGAGRDQVAA